MFVNAFLVSRSDSVHKEPVSAGGRRRSILPLHTLPKVIRARDCLQVDDWQNEGTGFRHISWYCIYLGVSLINSQTHNKRVSIVFNLHPPPENVVFDMEKCIIVCLNIAMFFFNPQVNV